MRARPLIAYGAGLAMIALALAAAQWQGRRGDEKQAMQARWDAAAAGAALTLEPGKAAAPPLPQRVAVRGRFVPEASVYLDNRQLDGAAGFFVITPLEAAPGAPWVLVNRGFVPRDPADRTRVAAGAPPPGEVLVEGLAVERPTRSLELGEAPPARLPGIWQNLDYAAYEQAAGRRVMHLLVQQTSAADDGLRRHWPAPSAGVDKHRGYAFQWYAIAAAVAVLMIFFAVRGRRHAPSD
jgi:cytochrome oxidase assembly protein ShyY1